MNNANKTVLPYEWSQPQQEFFFDGLNSEQHHFVFTVTTNSQRTGGERFEWLAAKCGKCGALINPAFDRLRDHARLHIAVELSRHPETVTA